MMEASLQKHIFLKNHLEGTKVLRSTKTFKKNVEKVVVDKNNEVIYSK